MIWQEVCSRFIKFLLSFVKLNVSSAIVIVDSIMWPLYAGVLLSSSVILCLSARKESRYREPPPTPPGYTALSISDLGDGHQQTPTATTSTLTHTGRRPPDYTTALQRSRMVTQSPDSHKAHQRLQRTRSPAEDQEAEEEEEGESKSSKVVALRKAKPVAQHTAGSPRPWQCVYSG